jgi:hypothetical protein
VYRIKKLKIGQGPKDCRAIERERGREVFMTWWLIKERNITAFTSFCSKSRVPLGMVCFFAFWQVGSAV